MVATSAGTEARHGYPRWLCRLGRQHPPDQAAPGLGRDRVHDPRQGRVPEPRRLGQGPCRALHHQGCRGARAPSAGRGHRRGHRRQYRDRPCAGRQCARLPHRHRHARDAEPGKEGHAAVVRRRSAARPGGALRQPDALRPLFGNARQGDRRHGAERRGHYETTGPEIWTQTDGKVDGFVCSVGTGGTLSGVGIALRERNPNVKIYLADPMGSGIYSWYVRHEWKPEGNSITEGIGNNHELGNIVGFAPDGQYQVTDEEMLPILFNLVVEEGLVLGGSTGINVAGAIRLARELGAGHTIVTILADSGTRYQSKLFNPDFLKEKNLPTPPWL